MTSVIFDGGDVRDKLQSVQIPSIPLRLRCLALLIVAGCFLSASLAQEAQVETSRRVVTSVLPEYPPLARRMNLQGVVRVRVTVSREGAAKKADIIGGNPIFVKSAQDAVSRWKWVPAAQETSEIIELTFQPR